jgi:DNA-binding LytR/AlgR family response regulator
MLFKPFFVWNEKKLVKIYPEQVLLIETVGNYTKIYLTEDKEYLIRSSLSTALKKLPEEIFIQIHRNYITSILYIDSISRDEVVVAEKPIQLGKIYYKPLLEKLNVIE